MTDCLKIIEYQTPNWHKLEGHEIKEFGKFTGYVFDTKINKYKTGIFWYECSCGYKSCEELRFTLAAP